MSMTTNAVLEREEKLQAKFKELYEGTSYMERGQILENYERWIANLSEDEYQDIVK